MIITAYQTLEDRDNIDEIEIEGPFSCNRADAWLGPGCYFWDTNMDWAIAWGRQSYIRRKKDYVIGRCQLDLSQSCFDLMGNVQHQMELTECIEVFRESEKIPEDEKIILPKLIEFLKQNELFPYKSIRCDDNFDKVIHLHFNPGRQEYMTINQRVQVCVIEKKDVILQPFNVVYKSKNP